MDSYKFLFNVIEQQTSLITIFILMISAYIPKGGTDYPTMTD